MLTFKSGEAEGVVRQGEAVLTFKSQSIYCAIGDEHWTHKPVSYDRRAENSTLPDGIFSFPSGGNC